MNKYKSIAMRALIITAACSLQQASAKGSVNEEFKKNIISPKNGSAMKNTNSIQILILVGLFAFSLQAVGQESEYQTTLEDIVEVQKRVEKGEKFGRATREMSFIRIASKQEERKKWYLRQEPNAKDKKKLDEALDALAKAFVKHGGTAKEYEWD